MKTSCPLPYQADTVSALVATGLAGLVAGSLSFGSFVDVRTMLYFVRDETDSKETGNAALEEASKKKKRKNLETVAHLFPVLWPYGAYWMVPLMAATTVFHLVAYYCNNSKAARTTTCCAGHKDMSSSWLYSGLAIFGLLPYTKIVMGKDIEKLCNNTDNALSAEELVETTRAFGKKHHVRTVVAMAAFGLSLLSLVHLPTGRTSSSPAAAAKK
jgi:Domain of unknown function (DUF1772)